MLHWPVLILLSPLFSHRPSLTCINSHSLHYLRFHPYLVPMCNAALTWVAGEVEECKEREGESGVDPNQDACVHRQCVIESEWHSEVTC